MARLARRPFCSSRKWLRSFALAAALSSGCTLDATAPSQDPAQAFRARSALLQEFGELRQPAAAAFMRYVLDRLGSAVPPTYPRQDCSVTLLASRRPIAVSFGGCEMALSSGLITSLGSEAELAFIVAHEMGHAYRGHAVSNHREQSGKRSALELDADTWGLGVMALAGYDPRAATNALVRGYALLPPGAPLDQYPAMEERVRAVEEQIVRSGWRPPGTIDRREFRQIQRVLRELR